jgi:hypothetical protein
VRRLLPWARRGVAAGALLGAAGWWLPWVVPGSGAAALVLLGLDLGDFWKFTAEWRRGLFEIERLFFFLPPPMAAMTLSLWMAGGRGGARWLVIPLVLFLGVVILPAFEWVLPALEGIPLVYEEPRLAREFGFQLYLTLATLLVLLMIPLWQRLGATALVALITVIATCGTILPAWALWRTWPVLASFYGGNLTVGPGVLVSTLGFALVLLSSVCLLAAIPRQ